MKLRICQATFHLPQEFWQAVPGERSILLKNAGYLVEAVLEFQNCVVDIKRYKPDLILLDINLPEQDGFRLCSSIRSFSSVPIIFITGRDTAFDELQALTLGGDDYITKPYNIPILLARINLLLRRTGGTSAPMEFIEYKEVRLFPISAFIQYKDRSESGTIEDGIENTLLSLYKQPESCFAFGVNRIFMG